MNEPLSPISLTQAECSLAARVGSARQISALFKGLRDAPAFKPGDDPWRCHIEGAAGELAVCKAMNWYWSASVDTFKHGADAGIVQVRTRSQHDYDLIVREDDDMLDLFVLVTGVMPVYRIRGWIRAGDAMQLEWRKDYGGRGAAWFVPAASLHSMDELKAGVVA